MMGKRQRRLQLVGPASWAALEITSAEPGHTGRQDGSSIARTTEMTEQEREQARLMHDAVGKVSKLHVTDGMNESCMNRRTCTIS